MGLALYFGAKLEPVTGVRKTFHLAQILDSAHWLPLFSRFATMTLF